MKKIKTVILISILISITLLPTFLYGERIVTLAPALTEIVFALGKGDKLVGNTNFCNYPEEAKKIARIGGYMDINLEVLINLKPDVILLYPENYKKLKVMKESTKLVQLKHNTLNDVFDAVEGVAGVLKVEAEGKRLIEKIKKELEAIRRKSAGKKKVKTLLIIGRNPDKLSNMFIVGKKDFLNGLLEIAGGVNAYDGTIEYPSISVESVIKMNPELIIELSAFNEGIEDDKVFELWSKFPFIKAVKNKKIKIIKDSMWVIPGPRIVRIAEKLHSFMFKE